ncbi:MAG: translocation/assembly module TamB domain-containing protein, partial [Pseudomonadota bacterium]
ASIVCPLMSISSAEAAKETIEAPRVTVISSIRDGAISGTLEAATSVEGEDVRLMAEPSLADQVWQVAALDIAYGAFTAAGQLAGDGGDLSALVGQIDLDGPIPMAIGGTRPTVTGTLSLTEETVFSDLSVSGVQGEGFDVETLDLKGAGQRDAITGTLASSGRVTIDGVSNPFDLAMPLSANLAGQTIEARPAGQLADIAFETLAPLTITFGDQSAQLAGRLGLLGGDIAVAAVQAPDVITASVNASGLTITDAARLFGQRGLRGDLTAQMSLSGAADDVTGAGKIELVGVSRADASGPPADILLDLSLSGDELLITGRGEAPAGALDLSLEARAPITTGAEPLAISLDPAAPLSFSLAGNGRLESLATLVLPPEVRLEGGFNLSATGRGLLEELRPEGRLDVSGGLLEEANSGLFLEAIDLSAELSRDAIDVSSFSAAGTNGGTVSGSGRFALDGRGDVDLRLDELDPLRRDDVTLQISGDLSLARPNEQTALTGDLVIDRANIDLDRLPAGGYTTLDVDFASANGVAATPAEPPVPIRLDIGLTAPRRIFVDGTGLTSEWSLDTRISGTVSDPRLTGTAEIVRGDIDFVGRVFQFTDSTVRFNGPPTDARLSVRAERDTPALTAGVNVTGTVTAPEFAVTSDPDLPEDEILSRVLFGRSPAQLTALEAAQLAAAVARLSGGGGAGFDLVGPVQDALGVDRLDFGVSEEGDASVGVGEYIGDDVYVELRTNARGDTGVAVEWTPLRSLAIGTELGAAAEPRFTVRWRRDFDLPGERPEPAPVTEAPSSDDTQPVDEESGGAKEP